MKLGLIGLGVMGRNLALNLADHGIEVVGFDRDATARQAFGAGSATDAGDLVARLPGRRVIALLVPAGPAVDEQVAALLDQLAPGDIVVDCGNSHHRDTARREAAAGKAGILFAAMGVSGGAEGARRGPALMLGAAAEAAGPVADLFRPIAARAGSAPCLGHFGQAPAGHFVKMVHNGIEYAVMQLIAEAVQLLRALCGFSAAEAGAEVAAWNDGPLGSYLLEITAEILGTRDAGSGLPLVDVIADAAGQKGTGTWSVEAALELGVPVPTITAAVETRLLSGRLDDRRSVAAASAPTQPWTGLGPAAVRDALEAGILCAHAQGFALMAEAARHFYWPIRRPDVAAVWRAGCIIRSRLMEQIAAAPADGHLLATPPVAARLTRTQAGWREAVAAATRHGLPAPALAASAAYWDALRATRLGTGLLQAQRDRFGAHGFARIDQAGVFHGPWHDRQ